MELALHAPGLGYYSRGARQFGAEGDFVTAPELGTLFGRTLARQLKELEGPILELGAGSGALADTLLKELDREYFILETSAALRGSRVRFSQGFSGDCGRRRRDEIPERVACDGAARLRASTG